MSRDGRRISFKPEGKVRNTLGIKDSKYDFYLGGTDSCQGGTFVSAAFLGAG